MYDNGNSPGIYGTLNSMDDDIEVEVTPYNPGHSENNNNNDKEEWEEEAKVDKEKENKKVHVNKSKHQQMAEYMDRVTYDLSATQYHATRHQNNTARKVLDQSPSAEKIISSMKNNEKFGGWLIYLVNQVTKKGTHIKNVKEQESLSKYDGSDMEYIKIEGDEQFDHDLNYPHDEISLINHIQSGALRLDYPELSHKEKKEVFKNDNLYHHKDIFTPQSGWLTVQWAVKQQELALCKAKKDLYQKAKEKSKEMLGRFKSGGKLKSYTKEMLFECLMVQAPEEQKLDDEHQVNTKKREKKLEFNYEGIAHAATRPVYEKILQFMDKKIYHMNNTMRLVKEVENTECLKTYFKKDIRYNSTLKTSSDLKHFKLLTRSYMQALLLTGKEIVKIAAKHFKSLDRSSLIRRKEFRQAEFCAALQEAINSVNLEIKQYQYDIEAIEQVMSERANEQVRAESDKANKDKNQDKLSPEQQGVLFIVRDEKNASVFDKIFECYIQASESERIKTWLPLLEEMIKRGLCTNHLALTIKAHRARIKDPLPSNWGLRRLCYQYREMPNVTPALYALLKIAVEHGLAREGLAREKNKKTKKNGKVKEFASKTTLAVYDELLDKIVLLPNFSCDSSFYEYMSHSTSRLNFFMRGDLKKGVKEGVIKKIKNDEILHAAARKKQKMHLVDKKHYNMDKHLNSYSQLVKTEHERKREEQFINMQRKSEKDQDIIQQKDSIIKQKDIAMKQKDIAMEKQANQLSLITKESEEQKRQIAELKRRNEILSARSYVPSSELQKNDRIYQPSNLSSVIVEQEDEYTQVNKIHQKYNK